jgi:hypothetical protein
MQMKVTIRKKQLLHGRSSLYLDFWPPITNPDNGRPQRREYLEIYLIDRPRNEMDKMCNTETMKLAENIRAKRQLDIQNRNYHFISDAKKTGNFVTYFNSISSVKKEGTSDNWAMAYKYFVGFAGHDVKFNDLDMKFCEDFKKYMLSGPAIGRIEETDRYQYGSELLWQVPLRARPGVQGKTDRREPLPDDSSHQGRGDPSGMLRARGIPALGADAKQEFPAEACGAFLRDDRAAVLGPCHIDLEGSSGLGEENTMSSSGRRRPKRQRHFQFLKKPLGLLGERGEPTGKGV